ncbi:hypothetical protein AWU68_2294 [Corynebacterium simulans]|uniref:Uncharacterized protein n=1 Tax=Corynebacterium simulans TaxID=146827 RepID=A0ABR5V8W3_9CORY|nr:hypothetical protein AWU68_2294 [Corynebacterium simulans]KXU18049.1 hypothetical protein WM41_1611 [Corynebacterium simulans]
MATVDARNGVGVELFHPHNLIEPENPGETGAVMGDVCRVIADVVA